MLLKFLKRLQNIEGLHFVAAAAAWIVDPTKNPPEASKSGHQSVIHGSQTSRNSYPMLIGCLAH